MKVITDGTEQLINLLANDTPLQLPTFRLDINNDDKNGHETCFCFRLRVVLS